jgi:dissimilatory sulfite reductase (desulfoviridin) alpha/beta subunit
MTSDRRVEDERSRAPAEAEVGGRAGPLDFDALKTGGLIRQRQKDRFTVRLKCPGGRMPLDRLGRILEVARRYGGDYVHLSLRQSIEIPYAHVRDLDRLRAALGEVGQEIASCGARVRVPTACSGCEYNPNGLADTQAMAQAVTDRYFGTGRLAHKFKMSFSGCPIDCARTNENDLGFQGAVEPAWDAQRCTACGICIQACKEGAIVEGRTPGRPRYRPARCLGCGDCIRSCPVDAWQARRTGWVVRVGGKHGRHPIAGQVIARLLPDDRVLPLVGAVLAWYEAHGEGQGHVRIGTLLLDPVVWRRFLADLAPALGEWAVAKPRRPHPNEIHSAAAPARPRAPATPNGSAAGGERGRRPARGRTANPRRRRHG